MKKMDIYMMTDIRAVTPVSGYGMYCIEWISPKGKATLTDMVELTECNARSATLRTAIKALERITESCELTMHVSETYVATAIAKNYVGDWMENGWKTKKDREVVSKDLWQQLMHLLSRHQYTVVYDISHEYSRWMADELTRKEKKKK
jgi:ribonuclease HI